MLSATAGNANARTSQDQQSLINAIKEVVTGCLARVMPEFVKNANPVLLAVGAAVLLHEYGRMIADGGVGLDAHDVIAESQWVTPVAYVTVSRPGTGTVRSNWLK